MTYAFLTDGLDAEQREKFDRTLAQGGKDVKTQARAEREALEQAMRFTR